MVSMNQLSNSRLHVCSHQRLGYGNIAWCFPTSHILAFVRLHAPGRAIAFVHLLDQSSEQAQFTWHVDNNPKDGEYGQIDLSFVFCITDTDSSMQVAGKAAFQYAGAGSGCVFSSGLWHASVHAAPGTLKVAVFLCK